MIVCKVLSQGIPGLNKTNLNGALSQETIHKETLTWVLAVLTLADPCLWRTTLLLRELALEDCSGCQQLQCEAVPHCPSCLCHRPCTVLIRVTREKLWTVSLKETNLDESLLVQYVYVMSNFTPASFFHFAPTKSSNLALVTSSCTFTVWNTAVWNTALSCASSLDEECLARGSWSFTEQTNDGHACDMFS